MFENLLKKNAIENATTSPDELFLELKKYFPEYRIKNRSKKGQLHITMRKGIVHMMIFRMKGKYILVKKDIPWYLDIVSLGTIEILEPFIGEKERGKVYGFLKERYSSER